MTTKVNFPKWGMGIEEGTVVRWLKPLGALVEKGEPLVEVETAKSTQEVPSPVTGKLVEILLLEGETALVNSDLAIIEES